MEQFLPGFLFYSVLAAVIVIVIASVMGVILLAIASSKFNRNYSDKSKLVNSKKDTDEERNREG